MPDGNRRGARPSAPVGVGRTSVDGLGGGRRVSHGALPAGRAGLRRRGGRDRRLSGTTRSSAGRGGSQRPEGAGDATLRTARLSSRPHGWFLRRRTVTRTPSPSAAWARSAKRRAFACIRQTATAVDPEPHLAAVGVALEDPSDHDAFNFVDRQTCPPSGRRASSSSATRGPGCAGRA